MIKRKCIFSHSTLKKKQKGKQTKIRVKGKKADPFAEVTTTVNPRVQLDKTDIIVTRGLEAEKVIKLKAEKKSNGLFVITKDPNVIGFTELGTIRVYLELEFVIKDDAISFWELPIAPKKQFRQKLLKSVECSFNRSNLRRNPKDERSLDSSIKYNCKSPQFEQTLIKNSHEINWNHPSEKQEEIEADKHFGRGDLTYITKFQVAHTTNAITTTLKSNDSSSTTDYNQTYQWKPLVTYGGLRYVNLNTQTVVPHPGSIDWKFDLYPMINTDNYKIPIRIDLAEETSYPPEMFPANHEQQYRLEIERDADKIFYIKSKIPAHKKINPAHRVTLAQLAAIDISSNYSSSVQPPYTGWTSETAGVQLTETSVSEKNTVDCFDLDISDPEIHYNLLFPDPKITAQLNDLFNKSMQSRSSPITDKQTDSFVVNKGQNYGRKQIFMGTKPAVFCFTIVDSYTRKISNANEYNSIQGHCVVSFGTDVNNSDFETLSRVEITVDNGDPVVYDGITDIYQKSVMASNAQLPPFNDWLLGKDSWVYVRTYLKGNYTPKISLPETTIADTSLMVRFNKPVADHRKIVLRGINQNWRSLGTLTQPTDAMEVPTTNLQ